MVLSFWKDVAFATSFRTEVGHRVFGGDRGVGQPDKPVSRRDKDIRSWYVTAARLSVYSLDTIRTYFAVRRARKGWASVVIFDRHIYDELANLLPGGRLTSAYTRFLLRCTPKLDIAFLLDADPQGARARKPEYPLEFLRKNRESYLALAKTAGMTVVPALQEAQVSVIVMQEVLKQRASLQVEGPSDQTRHGREAIAPVRAGQ